MKLERLTLGSLRIPRVEPPRVLEMRLDLRHKTAWQSCVRCRHAYPGAVLRDWCMLCLGARRHHNG